MCIEEPALEQVKLPLDVGTIVDTLWRDDKFYAARVIERRQMDAKEDFQYYVHFLKCEAHMSAYTQSVQSATVKSLLSILDTSLLAIKALLIHSWTRSSDQMTLCMRQATSLPQVRP